MSNFLENLQASQTMLIPNRRYRLVRDVGNPELDRRQRHHIANVPWTAGMVFFVESIDTGRSVDSPTVNVLSMRMMRGSVGLGHTGFLDLVTSLELIPLAVADLISESSATHYPIGVMQRLVDSGKLSLSDIEEAIKADD